ncbi:RAD52 motif-containing protein 1 isoform 2-T2 [Synchiropus picturatus]
MLGWWFEERSPHSPCESAGNLKLSARSLPCMRVHCCHAGRMDLEILEFVVPVESNKTLFVWNIEPSQTEAQLQEKLFANFSGFGPLYMLKVCHSDPLSSSGFYAVIKFYSASQASQAQRHTDGQPLFQSLPLKVRLASKQSREHQSEGPPLGHAKCTELANHFLGFNSWSSEIITLKQLTEDDDDEEEEEEGGRRTLRFGCLMQLTFPQHGRTTRGAAVVEETFTCAGPEMLLQKRCQLQKLVRHKALAEAFRSVLLVRLGEKVMVEVKPMAQLTLDEPDQLVKVNCLNTDPDQEDQDLDDMDIPTELNLKTGSRSRRSKVN